MCSVLQFVCRPCTLASCGRGRRRTCRSPRNEYQEAWSFWDLPETGLHLTLKGYGREIWDLFLYNRIPSHYLHNLLRANRCGHGAASLGSRGGLLHIRAPKNVIIFMCWHIICDSKKPSPKFRPRRTSSNLCYHYFYYLESVMYYYLESFII